MAGDVCADDAADALFDALEERFGPVLVLVNNAGVRADGLSPQLRDDQWARVIDTNLSAAFRTTRRALAPMLERASGGSSTSPLWSARAPTPDSRTTRRRKAGLIGFTKTVAVEVARRGITVNAVAPGFVETKLTQDIGNGVVDAIPARRVGTPEEVAACVRFLTSEEASYVTGTTLTVDGGMSA